MKNWPQLEGRKSVESLGWLELELRRGSAQARKRGGGRLWDVKGRWVAEIRAETGGSFDNTKYYTRRSSWSRNTQQSSGRASLNT